MQKFKSGGIVIGLLAALFLAAAVITVDAQAQQPDPGALAAVGEALFFDPALSATGVQSCASCHAPEVGYTGPTSSVNDGTVVYQGAIPGRFGNRKPPASSYAGDSPALHYTAADGWVGGMFWDGRATGSVLVDPLAEQAQGPFLNPLEHALPDAASVVALAAQAPYAAQFEQVWGPGSLDTVNDPAGSYERIVRSIAAYERSAQVNPFSSKFDLFWDNARKKNKDVTKIKFGSSNKDPNRWQVYRNLGLNDTELQGLAAFNDPTHANCASCHSLSPGPGGYPLFTDFGYANLGVPKNPDNPFYQMPPEWNPQGANWIDEGLGGYLRDAGYAPEVYQPEIGKFKVPTLRNVDLRPTSSFVKAYGHNGYFKSLSEVISFYAWRGMGGGCGGGGGGGGHGGGHGGGGGGGGGGGMSFPPPEVDQNLEPLKMINMMDQSYLVAFLKTLSDGYYQK